MFNGSARVKPSTLFRIENFKVLPSLIKHPSSTPCCRYYSISQRSINFKNKLQQNIMGYTSCLIGKSGLMSNNHTVPFKKSKPPYKTPSRNPLKATSSITSNWFEIASVIESFSRVWHPRHLRLGFLIERALNLGEVSHRFQPLVPSSNL